MSSWQRIFVQSMVNNGAYDGDRFVAQYWLWPRDTWFQGRLRDLRSHHRKISGMRNQSGVVMSVLATTQALNLELGVDGLKVELQR